MSPDDAARPLTAFSVTVPPDEPLRGNLTLSPDGRTLAYVAFQDGVAHTFRRTLNSVEPVLVPGTANGNSLPISPDGQWLAFRDGGDGMLKKVSLSGGSPVTLAEAGGAAEGAGSDWGDNDHLRPLVPPRAPASCAPQGLPRPSRTPPPSPARPHRSASNWPAPSSCRPQGGRRPGCRSCPSRHPRDPRNRSSPLAGSHVPHPPLPALSKLRAHSDRHASDRGRASRTQGR